LGNALGVERKAAADLGRSIVDGRLFHQMGSLRRGFRRPLLLVEGLCDGVAVAGVPWAAVRGALVSVSVCFGVPVLRATDARDSASLIATAARQLREPFDVPYVRPGYRPTGWLRRALYILQGLPGVGPQRARALLGVNQHYENQSRLGAGVRGAQPAEALRSPGTNLIAAPVDQSPCVKSPGFRPVRSRSRRASATCAGEVLLGVRPPSFTGTDS